MKKTQIELLQVPVEVCIFRDGKPLMTQVFQHTPIRFGRVLDNDIVLPFDGVSRHHCELRFVAGRWTLEDLKSLNGVEVNGERVASATFDRLGEFALKPVTIQMKVVKTNAPNPKAEGAADDATQPDAISATDETLVGLDPQGIVEGKRLYAEKIGVGRIDHSRAQYQSVSKKSPLLEINGFALMADVHTLADKAKARAVQITIVWHDVLLSVDEFLPGEEIIVEINGIFLRLGRAGQDRSELRCPTGTSFVDRPGTQSALLPTAPATWMADDGIKILARYVPQSRFATSGLSHFIENDLVDPLVVSGLLHGALAIATVSMTVKPPPQAQVQPERIAKIITTPPPIPAPVPPAPTPPPPVIAKATPTPHPTPMPIAKATPAPKVEKLVPKKIEPKVAQKPKLERPVIQKVAAAEPRPKKIEAPPTPTPKPFNAASVGALKALSMLSTAPASSTSNTDRIVIRRIASADGSRNDLPASTTSRMMSDLPVSNSSADNASVNGMSLATGKNAGYGTGGFSGKTGKRGVMGSVIGGASFTEIAKTEGLTREQVMKVVQKHQAKIQQCYERSLMNDPGLAGRAEFEWEITARGKVAASSVSVKETNLKNGEKLIECVKGVFASMEFPSAKNGSTTTPTIGLPFGRL